MSSFTHLLKYTGKRYEDNQNIEKICDLIDTLSNRDLAFTIIAMFAYRAQQVTPRAVINGSHFHAPSEIDQRTLNDVESVIFSVFNKLQFVEVSPVQPFGLNAVIAGLSQSKIISSVRLSEVNADITTALFRIAYGKYLRSSSKKIELGGMARITRAQSYDPKTKFLPHFRMFGHVTIQQQNTIYDNTECGNLVRHVCDDFDLMLKIINRPNSQMKEVVVELGDARIMQKLIKNGQVDSKEIRRHTTDPDFNVFEQYNILLPEILPLNSPQLETILYDLELSNVANDLRLFFEKITETRPDIARTMYIRLNRIADTGYYRGICFNLYGTNSDGLKLPVANGGYTDWAYKVNGNEKEICIISGIGVELIARYFF